MRQGKPSSEVKEICASGHFNYRGKMFRNAPRKVVHPINNTFAEFWLHTYPNRSLPDDYLYSQGEVVAEKRALMKYCRDQPVFDKWCLGFARHMLFITYLPIMAGSKIISQEAAYQDMNHGSSAGSPWCDLPGTSDKSGVWKIPGIRAYFLAFFYLLGSGFNWVPIWKSSLKVEVRAALKVVVNAIRGFVASPMEMTLAMNMLFSDAFSRLFRAGRDQRVPLKVGMTKFYRGWDALARKRSSDSTARCIDYTAMDSSVCEEYQEIVLDLLYECIRDSDFSEVESLDMEELDGRLTPEQYSWCQNFSVEVEKRSLPVHIRLMLREVLEHCCHSVIVTTGGDLIEKSTGNNSGSVLTTVLNTLVTYLNSTYAFAKAFQQWRSLEKISFVELGLMYDSHVFDWMYGDDHTQWTDTEIQEWFSMHVAAPILLEIGFTISVEEDNWEGVPLSGAVFLRYGFWFDERSKLWMPRAEGKKLLGSIMYGSTEQDPRWCLLRAFALLIEGWWNQESRKIFTAYINFLFRYYNEQFVDGVVYQGITWQQIKAVMRTPLQIDRLYQGTIESQVGEFKVAAEPNPLLKVLEQFGTSYECEQRSRL